jgi:hypothetical protein
MVTKAHEDKRQANPSFCATCARHSPALPQAFLPIDQATPAGRGRGSSGSKNVANAMMSTTRMTSGLAAAA